MHTPVACLLFAVGAHARPTSDKPSALLPATHNATQSTMKCGSPEELSANPLQMQGNSGQMPEEQAMLERLVKNATTYCEVGFNGGHSALFALRTNPQLHVVSFDLGDLDAKGAPKNVGGKKQEVADCLNAAHGGRLEMHWGDSTKTVVANAKLACDVIFVDGGHTFEVATADLANFKAHAAPTHVLVFDDTPCASWWCAGPNKAWANAKASGLVVGGAPGIEELHPMGQKRGFSVGRYPL